MPDRSSSIFSRKAENARDMLCLLGFAGDNKEIMPLNEVWRYVIGKDEFEPGIH